MRQRAESAGPAKVCQVVGMLDLKPVLDKGKVEKAKFDGRCSVCHTEGRNLAYGKLGIGSELVLTGIAVLDKSSWANYAVAPDLICCPPLCIQSQTVG